MGLGLNSVSSRSRVRFAAAKNNDFHEHPDELNVVAMEQGESEWRDGPAAGVAPEAGISPVRHYPQIRGLSSGCQQAAHVYEKEIVRCKRAAAGTL